MPLSARGGVNTRRRAEGGVAAEGKRSDSERAETPREEDGGVSATVGRGRVGQGSSRMGRSDLRLRFSVCDMAEGGERRERRCAISGEITR